MDELSAILFLFRKLSLNFRARIAALLLKYSTFEIEMKSTAKSKRIVQGNSINFPRLKRKNGN